MESRCVKVSVCDRIWSYVREHKDVLLCSLVFFVLAHGETLFQKIGYHDDIYNMFSIGTTYASGRWTLGLIKSLHIWFFGDVMWSLPTFNGALVYIQIAACICLLTDFFNLRSKYLRLIFSLLFAIHPSVICLLGYRFTGPAYAFSVLCAVLSGLMLSHALKLIPSDIKLPPVFLAATAILLGAVSLGAYQSYISFTLAILLYALIDSTQYNEFRRACINIVKVFVSVILIFAAYWIIWKISLFITGIEPTDYKGINEFGLTSILECLARIPKAYFRFFMHSTWLYPFNGKYIFAVLTGICAVLLFAVVCFSKTIRNKILVLLLSGCLLPAVHFSYLLSGAIAGLALFGEIMLFAGVLAMLELAQYKDIWEKLAVRTVSCVIVLLILCIGLFQIRYANQAAMKGELVQREYISYFTTLVTRIQSTEGYTTETPVMFYKVNKARGISIPDPIEDVDISPYKKENLLVYTSEKVSLIRTKQYLEYWCGFSPKYIDNSTVIPVDTLESMPRYPDDGSIQIIEDILVVNFG